jgi:hypothetical protein
MPPKMIVPQENVSFLSTGIVCFTCAGETGNGDEVATGCTTGAGVGAIGKDG